MAELDPAFEQQLADLSDDDWRSLTARVRPPTSSEQLREMEGKVLNADQLETFMSAVNPRHSQAKRRRRRSPPDRPPDDPIRHQ